MCGEELPEKQMARLSRRVKYLYLRALSLRDEPHELALGMALGIFVGMMPIIPFQTALALMLAVFFRVSKITAVIGTWVSNPLNWYFLYYYSYKLGALLLLLPQKNKSISSIMQAIRSGEEIVVIVMKIASAGGFIIGAFITGGLILGASAAIVVTVAN